MSSDCGPLQPIEVYPAHSYSRIPPSVIGCWSDAPDVHAYFFHSICERQVQCPAEYFVRIGRCHVVDAAHIIVPPGQWLAPSVTDWPAAAEQLPKQLAAIASGTARRLDPSPLPTVVIAKAGSQNFGHTLTEILPRLINIARSPVREFRLLLPSGMEAFHPLIAQICAGFGLNATLAVVPLQTLLEVDDLIYFGPVSQHNKRKSVTLLSLREAMHAVMGVKPKPLRRFYIERPAPLSRAVTNGEEIAEVFKGFGYEVVHPSGISLADQAQLFSQASHIAGPLGAGLTNMLHAAPGCHVLMFDPGLHDYFFWDLACLLGHRFSWLFTGPIIHYSWDVASQSFAVDPDGLRYALRSIHPAG